jgi:hypothetical protein
MQANATVGCSISTIKDAATTYFCQMAKNYKVQNEISNPGSGKENVEVARLLEAIQEKKFQVIDFRQVLWMSLP